MDTKNILNRVTFVNLSEQGPRWESTVDLYATRKLSERTLERRIAAQLGTTPDKIAIQGNSVFTDER